jgi:glyoxylase-like metal-dependent hydrolase (beta-lactamase superfamily II)
MNTIKSILLLTILFYTATLGYTRNAHAAENFSITEISTGLFVVKGPAGNTLVAADSDGLILIDGVPEQYSREYLGFVREETGIDTIKALILSHWHPEVTGLNAILGPQGAEIIAHENTRQWLGATIRERGETLLHTPMPENQLPNRTFYWGELELPFRDDVIQVGYLLQSHTDGDIYAWVKGADVLYTGPVIRTDGWATVDETTNGFIGGVTDAYDTLGTIVTSDTVIVPASGELIGKVEFDELDAMYKALKDEMVSLLRQSRGPEEVVIANPAQGLKPEWGDPSAFLDEGFRSFYGHLRNGRQIGGGFP